MFNKLHKGMIFRSPHTFGNVVYSTCI
uniref:Uncharacterized protein n=1 Tax=Anguilla anguilla TaxID=7936 RepID=A0A0E9XR42_ANGAN